VCLVNIVIKIGNRHPYVGTTLAGSWGRSRHICLGGILKRACRERRGCRLGGVRAADYHHGIRARSCKEVSNCSGKCYTYFANKMPIMLTGAACTLGVQPGPDLYSTCTSSCGTRASADLAMEGEARSAATMFESHLCRLIAKNPGTHMPHNLLPQYGARGNRRLSS
jgi:hypothetical protein